MFVGELVTGEFCTDVGFADGGVADEHDAEGYCLGV